MMNQSKISVFLFAVASLTNIFCVAATEAQIDGVLPEGPERRSFPIPSSDSQPISITRGPDGNFWFTEQNRSQLARITPDGWFTEGVGKIGRITTSGIITEFGSSLSLPFSIASGPDGNIWFTQRFGLLIGKITPTGQFTFYPIPNTAEQITPGHGNGLLFTEFGSNRVAKISTDGVVTESPEIPNSGPT